MYERKYQNKALAKHTPPEPTQKPRRRRRFSWKLFWRCAIGVAVVAVIVTLVRLPQLRVTQVDVVGTSVVDPEDVRQFVQNQISGNFLYVFPKASMLLVPTASLTKWTARAFPRFASVDVRRKGVSGLIVTVTEHDGVYLWCQDAADSAIPDCFFMNADGLVFAPAPFFSGDAYVKIFMGSLAPLPFAPLAPGELETIRTLMARLPAIGITPGSIRMVSEHKLEVAFSHHGHQAVVWFDPQEPIEGAIDRLATALATDPLKSDFARSTKVLQYLDVRFANKLVFKFE